MKVAIIGPGKSLQYVRNVIEKNYLYLETEYLEYTTYHQVVDILRLSEREFDGILFTGTTPYLYANQYLKPSVPWEYLPRNIISFLSALLKAGYMNSINIAKISVDSYDTDIIYDTYQEIGYSKDDISIYKAGCSLSGPNYLEDVLAFHKNNFQMKKVFLCVTGMTYILEKLTALQIPCVKIEPSNEVILQQISKLRLCYQLKVNEESKLVVMKICFASPTENSVYSSSQTFLFKGRVNVLEAVYLFAQKIGAAVIENTGGICYIFTTKAAIETETCHFTRLELLDFHRSREIVPHIFIGVGFGTDASEAKSNADLGCLKSQKGGIDSYYVVYENNRIVGPITNICKEEKKIVDEPLFNISQKTGISIASLHKLESLINQYHIETITPKRLSELLGISARSMNRILLVLEDNGYAEIVGKASDDAPGRPSRLIRLHLSEDNPRGIP